MTIEVPEALARSLEAIAAARRKSVQDVALDQLSLLAGASTNAAKSSKSILRILAEPPYPSSADLDALDAAIAGGRLPVQVRNSLTD